MFRLTGKTSFLFAPLLAPLWIMDVLRLQEAGYFIVSALIVVMMAVSPSQKTPERPSSWISSLKSRPWKSAMVQARDQIMVETHPRITLASLHRLAQDLESLTTIQADATVQAGTSSANRPLASLQAAVF